MSRADQIALHASSLRRWFGEKKSRRLAAHYVDSAQTWKWSAQAPHKGLQMELFA